MVLIYFLPHLLSSVCSLSAVITADYKRHWSICGLVTLQKPLGRAYLLVTPFLDKKEGLRARIINLFYSFAAPVIPDCHVL